MKETKSFCVLPRSVSQCVSVLIVDQVGLPSPEVLAVLDCDRLVDEGPHLRQPGLGPLHHLFRILNMKPVT